MMVIFLAFLISFSHAGGPLQNPQKGRWQKLMHIVSEEMKLLENAKKKGVEIKYRMLELHSERLKLIHEKNNREFMVASLARGAGQNKEKYFEETRAYYQLTKDFGFKILKEEERRGRKAEIMYALALNSRDYGRDNITEKYLLDVISFVSEPRNSLRHHAQTALADFYYNEKRYAEAISYYLQVIQNEEDDWKTKHLFNLSWCFLKNHDFDQAIETIKRSYFESKKPAFVDIRDQILENIGSFYVYAGRPLEGLEFYLDNEKNPLPYLMPMALKASEKGHERETKQILDAAQKVIDKHQLFQHQEELLHTYVDYYRHYNRFADHERVSALLVAYYKKAEIETKKHKISLLQVELKGEAIEKMRSLAGFLQIKLANDVKKDEANFNKDELQIVLSLFSHLIQIDPVRTSEYLYFRAETFFSVNHFSHAANSYVESVRESKNEKNLILTRKSLNSLLALTGMEVLPKEENRKALIFAYSHHIGLWPRDEKSELIYPKLFQIYLEDQDDQKAAKVLSLYNKNYPEKLKDQQAFMTKILDQFIEKKNTEKLNYWIAEFKQGFLTFSRETIEKTEIILGNLLFVEYQYLAKKGDRVSAARGFESLYVHKLYPDKVKYQAAFFAAMVYLELGETTKSFYWQELAHARMTEEEKLSRREDQLKMAERMYKLQDFVSSFKLSFFLLKKFCHLKDDIQNRLFEVSVMTSLVEEKPDVAEKTVTDFSRCLNRPQTRDLSLSQIFQFHEKKGNLFSLRLFVRRHPVTPFTTQYLSTLQKWYWEKSDVNLKAHIRNEFRELRDPEALRWLKELTLFSEAQREMQEIVGTIIWNKPIFNGEAFNKSLENYLLKFKSFKDKYNPLTQSSQTDLVILTSRLFSEVYSHIGLTIQGLRPAGMDDETMKQFQVAMNSLSQQFVAASKEYEKNLEKSLKEKETLAWGTRAIASVEDVQNPVFSFFTGLTMDKSKE